MYVCMFLLITLSLHISIITNEEINEFQAASTLNF